MQSEADLWALLFGFIPLLAVLSACWMICAFGGKD